MYYWAKQKIQLRHPDVLFSEHYYRRLWLATRNVNVARRDWLDELADTFRDFPGDIVTASGHPYDLPFVDDVFGDDTEMRWMGYYLKSDDSGLFPKTKCRKLERLQLLDLYFRIKYPKIAQHFGA